MYAVQALLYWALWVQVLRHCEAWLGGGLSRLGPAVLLPTLNLMAGLGWAWPGRAGPSWAWSELAELGLP